MSHCSEGKAVSVSGDALRCRALKWHQGQQPKAPALPQGVTHIPWDMGLFEPARRLSRGQVDKKENRTGKGNLLSSIRNSGHLLGNTQWNSLKWLLRTEQDCPFSSLNTSRGADSTTSLHNSFQCLTTLALKKIFRSLMWPSPGATEANFLWCPHLGHGRRAWSPAGGCSLLSGAVGSEKGPPFPGWSSGSLELKLQHHFSLAELVWNQIHFQSHSSLNTALSAP